MGRFEKAVQTESVLGPLRSGFKALEWRGSHADLADDDIDHDLFNAGELIFEKAKSIRRQLKLTFSADLRATTKVRAFAAIANHSLCVLQAKTAKAIEELASGAGGPLTSHQMGSLTLSLSVGVDYSPDEIIQSIVDGVEVPLKRILEVDPDLRGNMEFGKLNWNDALLDFNLGMLYSHVEGLWDDCLWNSYQMAKTSEEVTFAPRTPDWRVREAISRRRYSNLASEFLMHAMQIHEDLLYSGRLNALGPLRVKGVKKVGKRQEIQLAPFDDKSHEVQWLLAMRLYASEPYYKELLAEPQISIDGASLDQLLTAWMIVSQAANLLLSRLDVAASGANDLPNTWMPAFAPVLQFGAIANAIERAASCSHRQAKAIVEFLVFRGKSNQELWAQPLLPVGDEALVPLFAATVHPNLRRLLDVWLRQLGVDLGRRGPSFEDHIRSTIRRDIADSSLLASTAGCMSRSLKFTPPGGREEEIDVVAIVGDVLVLGEAKCFLEPVEAREVARHREKVIDAVRQVRRKAEAVEGNKDAFRKRAEALGFVVPISYRVQPIVILNNAIHVGFVLDGVPVVDEHILSVFFRGEFVEAALKEPGKPLAELSKRLIYKSAAEASGALPGFLAAPPQLQPLVRGVKSRWVPVPSVTEKDWRGAYLAMSCEPR